MRGIVSGRLFAVAVSIVALCLPAAALADEPEDPPRKAREGGILTSEEIRSVLAVGVEVVPDRAGHHPQHHVVERAVEREADPLDVRHVGGDPGEATARPDGPVEGRRARGA